MKKTEKIDELENKELDQVATAIKNEIGEKIIDGKKIVTVDIALVIPDPDQIRKIIDIDSVEMKQLSASIKENGFINFISVLKENDRYKIISGERRYQAALKAGLREIPVMVSEKKLSKKQIIGIQIAENLERKDVSAIETAIAYQEIIDLGLQQKEICDIVNRDKTHISKIVSINKILERIRIEILEKHPQISKEFLFLLAGVPSEKQMEIWEVCKKSPTIGKIKNLIKKMSEKKVANSQLTIAEEKNMENIEDLRRENSDLRKKYASLARDQTIRISELNHKVKQETEKQKKQQEELMEKIGKIKELETELSKAQKEIEILKMKMV